MVKLKITVRIIAETLDLQVGGTSARYDGSPSLIHNLGKEKEKRFHVIVRNPEGWDVKTLVHAVRDKYRGLYDSDLGEIRYVRDEDDCDLDEEETLFGLLVDEGRADHDGCDQSVSVKVIVRHHEASKAFEEGVSIPDLGCEIEEIALDMRKPRSDARQRFQDIEMSTTERGKADGALQRHQTYAVTARGKRRKVAGATGMDGTTCARSSVRNMKKRMRKHGRCTADVPLVEKDVVPYKPADIVHLPEAEVLECQKTAVDEENRATRRDQQLNLVRPVTPPVGMTSEEFESIMKSCDSMFHEAEVKFSTPPSRMRAESSKPGTHPVMPFSSSKTGLDLVDLPTLAPTSNRLKRGPLTVLTSTPTHSEACIKPATRSLPASKVSKVDIADKNVPIGPTRNTSTRATVSTDLPDSFFNRARNGQATLAELQELLAKSAATARTNASALSPDPARIMERDNFSLFADDDSDASGESSDESEDNQVPNTKNMTHRRWF